MAFLGRVVVPVRRGLRQIGLGRMPFTRALRPRREGLAALLESGFPGTVQRLAAVGTWGVDWHRAATSFIVSGPGGPLAHAGMLPLPLKIHGVMHEVGYIHAVCTRPDRRGGGLARAVIEAALRASDRRHKTQILLTNDPVLYSRFGFRTVPEHVVRLVLDQPTEGRSGRAERLLATVRGHPRLLAQTLERRLPVSDELGVGAERPLYTLNECLSPLWWLPDPGVVVSWELEGGILALYDVAGPVLPDLDALLRHAPGPVSEVVFHFSPDRFLKDGQAGGLAGNACAVPVGPGPVLMARGPFTRADALVMLPRPWR